MPCLKKKQKTTKTKATTTRQRRKRIERYARWVLRRKQSLYVCIGLFLVFLFLCGAAAVLALFLATTWSDVRRFDREDHVFNAHRDEVTFAHCRYKLRPPELKFNTDFCSGELDKFAFAWRHFELDDDYPDPDTSCMDLHEQVPCHTSHPWVNITRRSPITECPGFDGKAMPEKMFWNKPNRAPAINRDQLFMLMQNETVLRASQLIVSCPPCRVITKPFMYKTTVGQPKIDTNGKCIQKLGPFVESDQGEGRVAGWPNYAQCDNIEFLEESNCTVLDADGNLANRHYG